MPLPTCRYTHVYHIFYRVIMWHVVTLHVLIVLAFVGAHWSCVTDFESPLPTNVYCEFAQDHPEARGLEVGFSTVAVTHSVLKLLRMYSNVVIGKPAYSTVSSRPRSSRWWPLQPTSSPRLPSDALLTLPPLRPQDAPLPQHRSHSEDVILTCGFCVIPLLYSAEAVLSLHGYRLSFFRVAAGFYMPIFVGAYFVLTKPGVRVRSYWRHATSTYLGSAKQMAVPTLTWATYTSFWALTLTFKLLFGYYALVQPLAPAVRALWQEPFARIGNGACTTMHGESLSATDECAFESALRTLIILGRISVPILVYFFDTYIFFNATSAICSVCLAWCAAPLSPPPPPSPPLPTPPPPPSTAADSTAAVCSPPTCPSLGHGRLSPHSLSRSQVPQHGEAFWVGAAALPHATDDRSLRRKAHWPGRAQ